MKRLVVGDRVSRAEAEPLGRRNDRHQAGDRIHLHTTNAIGDRLGKAAAMEFRHAQPIIKKRKVEFPGFEHPANMREEIR